MKKAILGVFAVLLLGVLGACSSLERFGKSMSSDLGGGLNRSVKVVTQTGEVIFEDEGKFDIEVNDYRLKYIDENGKLRIVYIGGSTAILDEK